MQLILDLKQYIKKIFSDTKNLNIIQAKKINSIDSTIFSDNQMFIQINEDISFVQANKQTFLQSCSFLNISDIDNIYGISYDDFFKNFTLNNPNDILKITHPETEIKVFEKDEIVL